MLHAIRNCDTDYKKSNQSGKKTDQDNFKNARFLLEKNINNKKKLWKTLTEIWRTLKPLDIASKGERQSKISLKENSKKCFVSSSQS